MPLVTSEAIARIEYDAAERTLFVQFTSGEWYAYSDVPDATYRAFAAAESKGRFFQEQVRDCFAFAGPLVQG